MEEKGVWRTISGRRVFIKEGQSLSDAMKNSGKFNKNQSKEELAEKYVKNKRRIKSLKNTFGGSEEEQEERAKEIERLTEENSNIRKELTEKDITEAASKLDKEKKDKLRNTTEIETKAIEVVEESKIMPKIDNNEIDKLTHKILNRGIEEDYDFGDVIKENTIDSAIEETDIYEKAEKKVEYWEDNGVAYNENYLSEVRSKIEDSISEELKKEGYYYEYSDKKGHFYSNRRGIEKGYNEFLDYLDKKGIDYQISRSTNAGIVPSIYIKDNEGEVVFRIGNHANSQMSDYEAVYDKIFNNYEYIHWKEEMIPHLLKNIDDENVYEKLKNTTL